MANAKTLRKRIALVAAAALGVGLLVAAPASAASSLPTISAATSTSVAVGSVATINTVMGFTAGVIGDTAAITGVIAKPLDANSNAVAFGTATSLTNGATFASPTLTSTATGISTGTIPVTYTPSAPGVYTITLTNTAVATATQVWTIYAGTQVDTTNTNKAFAVQGSNVSSSLNLTSGNVLTGAPSGQATVRFANFVTATRYFVTVSGGTFSAFTAQATPTSQISATTGAGPGFNFTNGTNLTGGANFYTVSSTAAAAVDVQVSAASGTVTITVSTIDPITGLSTTFATTGVTFTAAASYSPSLSTAYIAIGAAAGVSPDVAVSASKALPAAQAATITFTLKDTAGVAKTGQTVSATISGPGTLGINATSGTYNPASTGRAITQAMSTNSVGNVSVWSDGTAGVSTITISVTDATSGATTVLSTKKVTFYGAVASLKVVGQNYFVLKAGGGTTGINTGLSSTSDTPAVTVQALDANGTVVPGLTVTGLSSNTAIISSSAVAEDTVGNDATSFYGGPGYYNANAVTSPLANSGDTATVTYRYTADSGVTYISAPAVSYTVGGVTPATVTIALDSATYAPAAKATLKITAKDSSGNPVADGTYANLFTGSLTSSVGIQGTLPSASVTFSSGVSTSTFYVPVNPVTFLINGTLGTSVATAAQGTKLTASATVTGSSTVDTGTAAAVAANAAAITALQASVASLSTTIASLVASITAQISALSALVKKILAKGGTRGGSPTLPATGRK